MSKVSVVIPCYNQGEFLDEAVESVLAQTFHDFEIIIVNDGSDDPFTVRKCNSYNNSLIKTINTDNQGLAAARNNGIAQAEGKYILPLDADDKIGKNYVKEAVEILDQDTHVGIVYCRALLFGAVDAEWALPEFSLDTMLKNNVIFCSALFRKSDWKLVGGYDSGMLYGWEDYDFWLSLIERNRKVVQLQDVHFFYRIDPNSMVRSKELWQKIAMFKRIYDRHSSFIGENIEIWLKTILEQNEPTIVSRLYVDSGAGVTDLDSVSYAIDQGTRIVCFNIEQFVERKGIRFDPVDCAACIEIFSIELLKGENKYILNLNDVNSNALLRDGNLFMFETNDPQIFLSVSEEQLQHVSHIRVSFTINSINENALRDIIKFITKNRNRKRKGSKFSSLFRAS